MKKENTEKKDSAGAKELIFLVGFAVAMWFGIGWAHDAYEENRETKYYETITDINNFTIVKNEDDKDYYSTVEVWFGTHKSSLYAGTLEEAKVQLKKNVARYVEYERDFLYGERNDTLWVGSNVKDK